MLCANKQALRQVFLPRFSLGKSMNDPTVPTGRSHSQRPSCLFFVTCRPLTRRLPELKVTWKCFLSTSCMVSSELWSGHDPSHVPSETLNEARFSAPLGASLHRPPGPSDSGGTGGGGRRSGQALSPVGPDPTPAPLPPGKAAGSLCAPAVCPAPPGPRGLQAALPSQRFHTCC